MNIFPFIIVICLLSLTEEIIKNAIYNIIIDNKNYLNYQNNILQISFSNKFEEKSNFLKFLIHSIT